MPTHTPSAADERAERLRQALGELGLDTRVEAREGLAVMTLAPQSRALDPALRRTCVREAQLAGFTHVALEIALEIAPERAPEIAAERAPEITRERAR